MPFPILRLTVCSSIIALSARVPFAAEPAPPKTAASQARIEVIGEWGGVPVENVQRALASVASNLLRHCPDRALGTIIVRRHEEAPISLYKKGLSGERQILLNAQGTAWCQYSYQFSHELTHSLCNYDRRPEGRNFWFEEALCETGSLFTLRQMAVDWKTDPPYANWRDFAPHYNEYVDTILASRDRRLPPDRTMSQWFQEHAETLAQQRHLTKDSMLVAAYLLPLFEDEPRGWESLAWINGGPHDADLDFRDFLAQWKDRTPLAPQAIIEKIQRLFGFL